jgi:hypothetical protein
MFMAHFALGVAFKPVAPKIPTWLLFIAPQFLDIAFFVLVLLGVEGIHPDANREVYGQFKGDILYSHSLVGALLISAFAFWIGKHFWKTNENGLILAGLSFSHWPMDLLVHHQDMAILPGNIGGFPLLGFGAWNYPHIILAVEIILAVIGLLLHLRWAHSTKTSQWWFVGTLVLGIFFGLMSLRDLMELP